MEPVSLEVERYVRELFDKFPCHQREGMILEVVGEGEVVVSVIVKPEHCTFYKDSMQGGYIGVFTDSPMWMALMTDPVLWGSEIRTKCLPIEDFSKVVKNGDTLKIYARRAEIHFDKKGRTFFLSAAEVRNSKSALVAIATAVNLLVKKTGKAKK